MVGAHNGQKQRGLILEAATLGAVILIEPVPHLFAVLTKTYADNPNIACLNRCVAPEPGYVSFYAPTEEAIKILPWGDQLGSMNAKHAVLLEAALATHIVEIRLDAITFPELVQQFDITSLGMLFTDTEGYDAKLLPHFPFDKVRPDHIIFEHKHADGVLNIGGNLGRLLIMLDQFGYNMRIIDVENCKATRRPE